MKSVRNFISATIISVLFVCIYIYVEMPTLAWGWTDWMFMVFIIGLIYIFRSGTWTGLKTNKKDFSTYFGAALCAIMIFLGVFVGFFSSSELMNASKFRNVLGKINEVSNNKDLTATDINKIIFIDENVAAKYGDKQITTADNLAMGSQVSIGEYTQQIVAGRVYYVAPILHGGFWQYMKNSENGTPGYVIVDAINPKDSKMVTKLPDGSSVANVYQYNGYFSKNLERHLRLNGYASVGLTDFSYELDDNFHPWWVISKYVNTIGFSGSDATGVVLVNPTTGEIKDYNINNLPAWVDRVQPVKFLTDQISWWGDLVHGVFNWSGADKLKLTQSLSMAYGNDGHCYFYAGLTSTGSDNTSVGFLMINSRTKEVKFFKSKGSSEDKAAASAEGVVQHLRYNATHARFYNLNGDFTFAFGLKDAEGLVKKYAFVNYDDYAIVGIGDDESSAYRDYRSKLNSKGNVIVGDKYGKVQEVKGIVTRFSNDNKDGNSFYYLTIDKFKNKMFVSKSDVNPKLTLTKIGDEVVITFNDGSEGVIDMSSFDNISFGIQETGALIAVEKQEIKLDSLKGSAK